MPPDGDVPLRDYVDARFEAEHRAADAARESMDHRLDGMNQFRDQLNQQARTFVSREEFEQVRKFFYMALGIVALVVLLVAPVAVAFIIAALSS